MKRASIQVLLLTEDTARDAHARFRALAGNILGFLDGHARLDHIAWEPPAEALAQGVLRANRWKSTKGEDQSKIVDLVRTIANYILDPMNGFVFFHYDGDCTWKRQHESDNAAKFQKVIVARVQNLVWSQLSQEGLTGQTLEAEVSARMSRLRAMVPFYSIEAWLYQNTDEAKRICLETYRGRDIDQLDEWAADRGLLDEVNRPKEKICLGDQHNLELARNGFPTGLVYEVGKSFTATMDALRSCSALAEALAGTYPVSPPT